MAVGLGKLSFSCAFRSCSRSDEEHAKGVSMFKTSSSVVIFTRVEGECSTTQFTDNCEPYKRQESTRCSTNLVNYSAHPIAPEAFNSSCLTPRGYYAGGNVSGKLSIHGISLTRSIHGTRDNASPFIITNTCHFMARCKKETVADQRREEDHITVRFPLSERLSNHSSRAADMSKLSLSYIGYPH